MAEGSPPAGSVLRRAISGQRRQVAAASLLGTTHQACEAMVPVVIGVIIDQAVATGSTTALLRWLGILAALFLLLSTCYRTAARITDGSGELAAHRLRTELAARVLDPRGGADTGRLPGALTAMATGDAARVGAVVAALPYFIAALAGLAVSAVALLRVSVPLGLLILLGVPPLLWLGHRISLPLERRSEAEQSGPRTRPESPPTSSPDCACSRASAPNRPRWPATAAPARTPSRPPCAPRAAAPGTTARSSP